jgi:hypothetical protein
MLIADGPAGARWMGPERSASCRTDVKNVVARFAYAAAPTPSPQPSPGGRGEDERSSEGLCYQPKA